MANGDVSGLENMGGRTVKLASGVDVGEEKALFPLWWFFEKNKMQSCGGERDRVRLSGDIKF